MMNGRNLIDEIKNNPNPDNLRKIYSELKFFQKNNEKLEKYLEEICELIDLIGKFLVFGEIQKDNKSVTVFDAFAELDFISEFTRLSSYDNNKINLELIKTFSFLMINMKDKTSIYYLFSGNFLNKIINKAHNNVDEEYLSHYINFLKSLTLRLDETTIQLFYIENLHSFPLIENALEFYNHEDSMIRSVVRSILLNVLKIKNLAIESYFCKLPSVSYFSDIVCHLRDICYKINESINDININNIIYFYDELVDETLFLDDLFSLNLNKINYILLNNLFFYLILPIICGSICSKNDKISKNLSLFLLIYFFCNIKNEGFKNSLFSLLFFDKMTVDIEYFIGKIPEKKNYSNKLNFEKEKNKSFTQFVTENYSQEFFLNLSKENNIYYLKYNKKYKELDEILTKTKNLSKELGRDKSKDRKIKEEIEKIVLSFIPERDMKEMYKYHKNLSMSSGLNLGKCFIKEKGDYYNISFISFIDKLFNQAINNDNFYSTDEFKDNIIKKNIYSLLEIKDNIIIILINILIFIVQSKEINISKELLKYVGLENIQEKIYMRNTIGFDFDNNGRIVNNNDDYFKTIMNKSVKINEPYFDKNNFDFNNEYFKTNKMRYKKINDGDIVEKLSSLFLNDISLLPFTSELICYNINNLCLGWNNNLYINPKEDIINNIKAKYKMILYDIYYLIEKNKKNRELGFRSFRYQWLLYKNMNNNKIFEIIKNNFISSCFILISKNNEIENCPEIIKYDKKFNDEQTLNNYLIMFILLHDIKELLFKSSKNKNYNINKELIKNNFPLDYSQLDLKINEQYDLRKLNQKEIYRRQIEYSYIGNNDFILKVLVIYRSYLYFCDQKKTNIIQINQKYSLKNIILLENDENFIECIIINKENNEKVEIIIKFKNKKLRDEALNFINNKIDLEKKRSDGFKFYKYIFRLLKSESTNTISRVNTYL